jgi:DNA-binding PadR family transcriptional regulator
MSRKPVGWKNLWSLTVLALLRLRPMHPYEIHSVIKITHKDDFLNLKPGSLYNSISRLVEARLIEAVETSRAGGRPERTTYRITNDGVRELHRWLCELLATPDPDPTQFYAALSFLGVLEPADAIEQLQHRANQLKTEIDDLEAVLQRMVPQIGRLVLIEVEYALACRTAERDWVKHIVSDLRNQKLDWNPKILRASAGKLLGHAPADSERNPD